MNDLFAAFLDRLSHALDALERRPEPLLIPIRADDRRGPRALGRRH